MKTTVGCLALVLLAAAPAAAQQKPAPTLRGVLLEQLKISHNSQDWFVPASQAVAGLTFEQALWKPDKGDHSVASLVHHLAFWNKRALIQLQGGKPEAFSGNNEETFEPPKDAWEKTVEAADEAKLLGWASTISHVATHNAYHTGQILTIRKLQGSWDPSKGVK